ncbi:prolyl oligopeptidase family serine peptidase [Lipingzhangella sp. LS1_29]|uniref:Prolyl oligopeptidase family serine peptidase n=1 Tax=Lipingzhangella rawalii TaxID=2055835 RepID=A0ABU2H9S7_9ACTN|nr:prolyl oligopeptidase family serine peptidase [Lipingzhangella rawalii]MDS1272084.1 prolyl oligopeptidase family serine peptidase [Lipingzhangella rawalii]
MSFPRQYARTRRFTLGAPSRFRISPDGRRVAFVRSQHGTDPQGALWLAELGSASPQAGAEQGAAGDTAGDMSAENTEVWHERLLVDPRSLAEDAGDIPPEERARRERARETGGGIVSYSTDRAMRTAVFALGGRLYVVSLASGEPQERADGVATGTPRELPVATPAVDPVLSPDGSRLAYVHNGAVRVLELDSGVDMVLAHPGTGAGETPEETSDTVTWGLAEFIAAEEMQRTRGMWWSPDSRAVLAARVDTAPVQRWHLADPASPESTPQQIAYPAAGTANAEVRLAVLAVPEARSHPGPVEPVWVQWDRAALPYVVAVHWSATAPPTLVVQSRDQQQLCLLTVAPHSGSSEVLRRESGQPWVEIPSGVPARTGSGALVWIAPLADTYALNVDGQAVTPPDLYVRAVVDAGVTAPEDVADGLPLASAARETVLFTASTEPTEVELWAYDPQRGLRRLGEPGGMQSGRLRGGTLVAQRRSLHEDRVHTWIERAHTPTHTVVSHAQRPELAPPRITLMRSGQEEIRTAVLLPSWYEPGSGPLPVLLDPYGGPHAQRVVAAYHAFLSPQWFAEQGFAVVVADGRGSPGRGLSWEHALAGNLADPPLEDQVTALHAAAERHPELDLNRVGIRGWSFGGYLAALAVLRRPEVFHAAIAGAPVTDWRLYDTHYTERYLGMPEQESKRYAHSSLLEDADRLERPLMLIHGLVDDNVVFAHTQRLSSALLAAGRTHTVLPLAGVTHMPADEVAAENLLLLQVDFLNTALLTTSGHRE